MGDSPANDATNIGRPPQQRTPSGKVAAKPATGQRPAVKQGTSSRPAVAGATAKPKTGARPAVKPATGSTAAVKKAAPLTARPAGAQEPETEAATNIVQPKTGGAAASSRSEPERPAGGANPTGPAIPRTASGIQMVAPDKALDDFKSFVSNLPAGDKLAFLGAAGFILTCFLPWKETAADGEILGLMSLGIIDFLVMIAVIAALVIRVRRVMPQLNPLVPWLVQLGGAGFSIIWCLVYIGISTDLRKTQALVGNFEQSVSAPSFGVWLAIICGGATVAGTLMGLKTKPA